MTALWATAGWVVGAYLAGAVPFGLLLGFAWGVDIRQHGSRNIGATNCLRVCGAAPGALAFALDVAKGFLPVLAAVAWLPRLAGWPETPDAWGRTTWLLVILIAVAPILGHVFPVYLGFRGGKAVATSLGVLLAMPALQWLALAALGVWTVIVLITRYVSVGSSVAALVFLGGYLFFNRADAWGPRLPITVFVIALVAMVLVRHRSNYVRLLKGTENKIGTKKKEGAAEMKQ